MGEGMMRGLNPRKAMKILATTLLLIVLCAAPAIHAANEGDPAKPVQPHAVTNQKGNTYYLHSTEIKSKSKDGKSRTFYFFTKKNPADKGTPVGQVPEGYEVSETKNGLPVLRKIKKKSS